MKKRIALLLALLMVAAVVLSACGDADKNTEATDAAAEVATPDSAVLTTVATETTQETAATEAPTDAAAKVDENINWSSMFRDKLQSLDSERHNKCALIYLNDDKVPELYVNSVEGQNSPILCYIDSDTESVKSIVLSGDSLTYQEKTGKFLVIGKQEAVTLYKVYDLNAVEPFVDSYIDAGESLSPIVEGSAEDESKSYDWAEESFTDKKSFEEKMKADYDTSTAKEPELSEFNKMLESLSEDSVSPAEWQAPQIAESYQSKSAEDYVATYKEKEIESQQQEEGPGGPGSPESPEKQKIRIPEIKLTSEYADAVNQEIRDNYLNEFEKETTVKQLDYQALMNQGVLTVVITEQNASSNMAYHVYHFNTETGERVTTRALLSLCKVDWTRIASAAKDKMRQQFMSEGQDEASDKQNRRTIDDFSFADERVWFDENRSLNVLYKKHNVAGAVYVSAVLTFSPDELPIMN